MAFLRTVEGLILLVLRLALGALFLWAAYQKLYPNPQAFADSIKGFQMLPPTGDHLVVLATFVVPWVEAIAGACLVLGLWSRAAAGILLLTLAAFCAAIVSVLQRGIDTKCGCFGEFSPFCPEAITTCNLIQNAALAGVALLILLRGGGLLALDGRPKPRATTPATPPTALPRPNASAPSPAPSIKQAAATAPKPAPSTPVAPQQPRPAQPPAQSPAPRQSPAPGPRTAPPRPPQPGR